MKYTLKPIIAALALFNTLYISALMQAGTVPAHVAAIMAISSFFVAFLPCYMAEVLKGLKPAEPVQELPTLAACIPYQINQSAPPVEIFIGMVIMPLGSNCAFRIKAIK